MRRYPILRKIVVLVSLCCLAAMVPVCVHAQSDKLLSLENIKQIEVQTGKSLVLESKRNIYRISVANPEIADVTLLSRKQVYLNGKTMGTTTLSLWGANDNLLHVFDVLVTRDVTRLKEIMRKLLPDEADIRIDSANESVTLSGIVNNPMSVSTAVSLAEAYAPQKVINLLSVGGVQQVMLEVRVAEVSKSVLKRLGFNFAYLNAGQLLNGEVFYSFLNSLTGFDDQGDFRLSNKVGSAFTFKNSSASWSVFIDALKQNGLIKVLAEPNVVCQSGQSGSFLAGGEIPIPIPQGLGTVAIEYRPFGVGLEFKPTVLGNGRINISVRPEVSELDATNAINLNGATIPAITTRRVETNVELGAGQSFAIAGLIKDSLRESIDKFPGLGDVPVLGALFSSSEFQKNLSELVVIVTPHLVEPVDGSKLSLPTEKVIEPNDIEFYLFGQMQGDPPPPPANATSDSGAQAEIQISGITTLKGFDGEVGHTMSAD